MSVDDAPEPNELFGGVWWSGVARCRRGVVWYIGVSVYGVLLAGAW